jgi:hypothetical protein
MKRLLIMLVLSVAAVVACGPSGTSPATSTGPAATAPAVETPSLPAASESAAP